jgi:hypothetical protein
MPITATARGTANILPQRIAVDMSEKITILKPASTPLTVLSSKMNTAPCSNYRYDWMEDSLMARWTTSVGVTLVGDVAITVAAGTGTLVGVNDLIKVAATGEVLRVTAIVGDVLTITRSWGVTAAAEIPAGSQLLIIGNAMMQGSGRAPEQYNQLTPQFNYTQIFKTGFSVTNTLEATKLYGGSELNRLRAKKAEEHQMSKEYAFLFGERALNVAGAQPISSTGGVLQFIAGSTANASRALAGATEAHVDAWVENIFAFGSKKKVWLCSSRIITFVNSIAKGRLDLVQANNDSTYGLDIVSYRTPHGTLQMIHHPLFVGGYAGLSIALDMEEVAYKPLKGRDTKYETNIQNNDEDGQRDQYITEAGIEVRQPQKHGSFTLTA